MYGKRPIVASLDGVVAAAHPLAAAAGATVLRNDGNAFDAAVACAAALNVVEPFMSGIAGLGMATCFSAADQRVHTLDFVTRIPQGFDASITAREEIFVGPRASAPPGNLAGWCSLLDRFGTRSLADVLAPAIELAERGFPVTDGIPAVTQEWFDVRRDETEWQRVYTNGHANIEPGWILRQPDLADTLSAIASVGKRHLYDGPLGERMLDHLRGRGGFLSEADLQAVAPEWLQPLATDYRGWQIHTLPPPAESFQFLLTLAALRAVNLGECEPGGAEHFDALIRACRLASELRVEHNKSDRQKIEALFADEQLHLMTAQVLGTEPLSGRMQRHAAMTDRRLVGLREHTTSISAGDRDGNMVCITQSLGSIYGSGVVIPGTGVCMNNFLNWGDLDPASPNALSPGEPMAMCLAPSVALRDGAPVLALGTPGSYGILQTQPQVYSYLLDFGMPLQEAIEAPRARLWDGTLVHMESRVGAPAIDSLRARGHDIELIEPWSRKVGGFQGVYRDPASGALFGGADPRRDGYAIAT
tara:strand:- start:3697 stop:5289 length:1593 start_codon:yes stop_codon:yes gene_type:complete